MTANSKYYIVRNDIGFFNIWGGDPMEDEKPNVVVEGSFSICSYTRDKLNQVRSFLGTEFNKVSIEKIKAVLNDKDRFEQLVERCK